MSDQSPDARRAPADVVASPTAALDEVQRLRRTLRALSNSSHAMVRATDEAGYLADVCRIVVEDCGFALVWIGFAEHDAARTVRAVAAAGVGAVDLSKVSVSWADHELGRGPTGTAIRTSTPRICRNIREDPGCSPWWGMAEACGLASCIAFPLLENGRAIGAISIYAHVPDAFSGEERALLGELANDLSYGVAALRLRASHVRAEEALRRSEARYRGLVELSPDAVFVHRGGRIDYLNSAAVQLFGAASPEQLLGRPPSELFHPESRAGVERRFPAVLEGEVVTGLEEKIVRFDGAVRNVEVAAAAFDDQHGRAIQVVLRDVTDRRRAEDVLRESESRFRTMADGTPLMIWVTDRAGKVDFVNRAYREFFGIGLEDLAREGWSPLVHPDDAPAYLGAFARSLRDHRSFHAQARVRRSDGEWRWVESFGEPRFSASGEFVGIAGSSPDVTERHRAEEAVRESDRRKGEFLAVLSHELRNPLAPIRNSLFVLDRAPAGSAQAQRAKAIIDRQVSQLTHLVDDLLDVTRITRNKVQLQRAQVELNDLVRRTVDDHRSVFESHELPVEFVSSAGPLVVDGDPHRLAQIVGNLLHNAAKFSVRGGSVRVSVELEPDAKRAVIRVADTGLGMDEQLLARLFQPFMQADATLDRSKGGLGLGLALVKGLVELHGGEVSARSDGVGKGSEFVVRLPLSSAEATSRPGRMPAPGARRRVLVIEDNVDAANSLRDVLLLGEHEVAVARDGPEGLGIARGFRPEVVLCDIGLPGMDGYAVARAFRADENLASAFIVALSGYAQPEDLQKARDAGFDYHLAKPPRLEKLEELLRSIPREWGAARG